VRSMGRVSFWCLCALGVVMLAAGVQTALATSEDCNYNVKVNGAGVIQPYPQGQGCPTTTCETSLCAEHQSVAIGFVWVWCACDDEFEGPLCTTDAHTDWVTVDQVLCYRDGCTQPYVCDLTGVAPPGPDGFAQATCKCKP